MQTTHKKVHQICTYILQKKRYFSFVFYEFTILDPIVAIKHCLLSYIGRWNIKNVPQEVFLIKCSPIQNIHRKVILILHKSMCNFSKRLSSNTEYNLNIASFKEEAMQSGKSIQQGVMSHQLKLRRPCLTPTRCLISLIWEDNHTNAFVITWECYS